MKILYTPLNGTGLKPVLRALEESGFHNINIVAEQEKPDGSFPTCPSPNPELPEVMEYCMPEARRRDADIIIIATDPDCDRIGVACKDAGGLYQRLNPDEVGILLLDFICSRHEAEGKMPENPVFMKTIVTTSMAERVAEHYGLRTINTLTGFKYIGEQIGKLGKGGSFVFGMEESCGYLSNTQVRDKDGVNAALLVCGMAQRYKREGITLRERLSKDKCVSDGCVCIKQKTKKIVYDARAFFPDLLLSELQGNLHYHKVENVYGYIGKIQ